MTTHYGPDIVNHPPHYKTESGLEAVQVIEAFAPDNAHRSASLKYLLRAGKKGDTVEDLRKAIWWIQREIEHRRVYQITPAGQDAVGFDVCGGDIPDGDFQNCDDCHSRVCQVTGICQIALHGTEPKPYKPSWKA